MKLTRKMRQSAQERRLCRFGRREHADDDEGSASLSPGGNPLWPGKAANAGGVATSGLEMAQNSMRISGHARGRCAALQNMKNIHAVCHRNAEKYGTPGNYVNGANIASS